MKLYNNGAETDTISKITVRQLLTHSSGIGSGAAWERSVKKMSAEDIDNVESFVAFLSKEPLSFLPGTKQEYSGIGAFSVLTGIIQKITGETYAEFLKKEIFEPCQMRNTTFVPSAEQWERVIEMHDKQDGKSKVGKTYEGCVFENIPTQNYLGGAGLISCANDYLNFAQMLLNGGIFDGKRVLSEASVSRISKPRILFTAKEWWGLGVRVISDSQEGELPIGSYGWSGAYGTHFWIDPSNRIIGVYMKNSRYDGGSGAVTSKNFETDVYFSLKED
jgi:CubicO group peptidase (beta-lactamase class C family)